MTSETVSSAARRATLTARRGRHWGRFEAIDCRLERGFVHATGYWVRFTGSQYARRPVFGERQERTWPATQVRSIRWRDEPS